MKCPYCGVLMNRRGGGGTKRTNDHIIPVIYGGDHIENNLIHCCMGCNSAKGGFLPDDPEWHDNKIRSAMTDAVLKLMTDRGLQCTRRLTALQLPSSNHLTASAIRQWVKSVGGRFATDDDLKGADIGGVIISTNWLDGYNKERMEQGERIKASELAAEKYREQMAVRRQHNFVKQKKGRSP